MQGAGGEINGGGAHEPGETAVSAAIVLQEPSPVAADGSNRAHIVELLRQARSRWLKNTEVCDILLNYKAYDFSLSSTAPVTPPGACVARAPLWIFFHF